MSGNQAKSFGEIVAESGRSEDEVRRALVESGFRPPQGAVNRMTRIDPQTASHLQQRWLESKSASKPTAAGNDKRSAPRQVGSVLVSRNKKRVIVRPPSESQTPIVKPSIAKPVTAKAPPPAPPPPQAPQPPKPSKAKKAEKIESAPPPAVEAEALAAPATIETPEALAMPEALAAPPPPAVLEAAQEEEEAVAPPSEAVASEAAPSAAAPASKTKNQVMDELYRRQIEAQRKKAELAKAKPAVAPAKAAKPPEKPALARKPEKPRRAGATLHMDERALERRRSKAHRRRKADAPATLTLHGFSKPTAPQVREVQIPAMIEVPKLAERLAVKSATIVEKLMGMGMIVDVNKTLDRDTAWILVEEMGHKPVAYEDDPETEILDDGAPTEEVETAPRAPVVTVMGHVDHGKTSLLDLIRKKSVAAAEVGGITQHIGAYRARTSRGEVTFLDTPGHELFTQMRARGAQVTDIVILVVAADDGVKPQTIEAINHAKAANAPIVVAVNKIDLAEADVERARRELSEHGVLTEEWGGDAALICVSAKTGQGIDDLLEAVALQAEIMELKAPIDSPARGVVIEARIERGRGVILTALVREGVLRKGCAVLCGAEWGRVRAMQDDLGHPLEEAGPSRPVEFLGLSGLPAVGSELREIGDKQRAREVAQMRQSRERATRLAEQSRRRQALTVKMMGQEEDDSKIQNFIVKADVAGSVEALSSALENLPVEKITPVVIHGGVGAVTETDANLAQASNATIVAFNVRPNAQARKLIEQMRLTVIAKNIIYDAIEIAREMMEAMRAPEIEEKIVGAADVRQVFSVSKTGNVAGCLITEGAARPDLQARVVRDGATVYEGKIASLRRFKEDAAEVRAGVECGIMIHRFNDIKAGDTIELFETVEVEPASQPSAA